MARGYFSRFLEVGTAVAALNTVTCGAPSLPPTQPQSQEIDPNQVRAATGDEVRAAAQSSEGALVLERVHCRPGTHPESYENDEACVEDGYSVAQMLANCQTGIIRSTYRPTGEKDEKGNTLLGPDGRPLAVLTWACLDPESYRRCGKAYGWAVSGPTPGSNNPNDVSIACWRVADTEDVDGYCRANYGKSPIILRCQDPEGAVDLWQCPGQSFLDSDCSYSTVQVAP